MSNVLNPEGIDITLDRMIISQIQLLVERYLIHRLRIFHKLEERQYFSLDEFNKDLWKELEALNKEPFKKKEHNRYYYWEEEKLELMPLPSMHYEYMERKTAKVSSDFHIRFDNAYYSVDKAFLHKKVSIKASSTVVRIYHLSA